MGICGTIPFGLMLNTEDRTVLFTHDYGYQTRFDEPELNRDYSRLFEDIEFSVSNEYGSLTLRELKFALHDNKIEVVTDYEYTGDFSGGVGKLVMPYLDRITDMVNRRLDENEVDFPESMITYNEGVFHIPFLMSVPVKKINWYRVKVIGICFLEDIPEFNDLLP